MAVSYILPMYLAFTTPPPVVSKAEEMLGTYFLPGISCQCANFVRYVFSQSGISLPSVNNPTDSWLIPGEPIGPGYADSFAGDEVGPIVKKRNILPGDIVMYSNTYGSWPEGVITHVGIYVGDGKIVHRPTSQGKVCLANLTYATIAQIRRPKQLIQDSTLPEPKPTPVKM